MNLKSVNSSMFYTGNKKQKTLYNKKENSSIGLKRGRKKINGTGVRQRKTNKGTRGPGSPQWRRAKGDGRAQACAPALGGEQGSTVHLCSLSLGSA